MLTIATIVPNDYFAPWNFVRSVFRLPPKYLFKEAAGPLCSKNRNYIWEEMKLDNKDNPADLLFIDSDIVFEPEDVATIESDLRIYDVVTGLYILKGWDWSPGIFKKENGVYAFTPAQEGIFEVEACGGAFLGISKRVIAHPLMAHEPFEYIREGNVVHGEDVSFCQRAREAGFKIFCDSSIKVGHMKTQIIRVNDKEPDIY
jgi:hypothetical protein